MKHLFTLLLLCGLLMSTDLRAQTIRRCNNNPGISGPNVYTSIQAAHDAAVSGDIIYVEPSLSTYGDLVCTKRLTIIGNGFFLTENTNDSFESRRSMVGVIRFNFGSANSVLKGISITGQIVLRANNITVNRCLIEGNIECDTQDTYTTITQCVLRGGSNRIYGYYSLVTITLNNNIIDFGQMAGFRNSSIINNIFTRRTAFEGIRNTTVANNIFVSEYLCNSCTQSPIIDLSNTTVNSPYTNSGLTISNNIVVFSGGPIAAYSLPTDNGNINNADLSTTFVSNVAVGNISVDKNYQLAPSSPARGIGTGGTDAGAFGGTTPYVLAGQPNVPIITNFTTSGAATPNTPLTVTVSVRSNN